MRRVIRDLVRHRELLLILVLRNLRIRYKNSVLGFFWTLLGPVLLILVYAVFLRILGYSPAAGARADSLSVLITGIFVWQYLAMCLGDAAHAVIGNANLVKKTPFPRLVLPLAMVLANLVNFLLSLVVAGIYLAATGARLEGAAWLAPAVATNVALCAGVSLVVSCVNVFFRDVQQMTSIVTVAWFFLSPVIYTGDVVGRAFPALERLYYLNPMAGLLALYRRALLGTPLPPAGFLGVSVAAAWALLLAGGLLFQRLQVRFADEL